MLSENIHPNSTPWSDQLPKKLQFYKNCLKILHIKCPRHCDKNQRLKRLVKALSDDSIYGLSETWFNKTNNINSWALGNLKGNLLFASDAIGTKNQM